MPTLLAYGDSNTHGSPPVLERGATARYDAGTRWPRLAAAALGWEVVEEGLPGRTAQWDDPARGYFMNGFQGLQIALTSHWPLDAMTLMLGTNDVKDRFGATPEIVTAGIAGLIDLIQGPEMAARHPGLRVLLICPPPCHPAGLLAGEFRLAAAKARALAPLYAELAAARGLGFLDAGAVMEVSPEDGVHFTPEGHASLARAVAAALRTL